MIWLLRYGALQSWATTDWGRTGNRDTDNVRRKGGRARATIPNSREHEQQQQKFSRMAGTWNCHHRRLLHRVHASFAIFSLVPILLLLCLAFFPPALLLFLFCAYTNHQHYASSAATMAAGNMNRRHRQTEPNKSTNTILSFIVCESVFVCLLCWVLVSVLFLFWFLVAGWVFAGRLDIFHTILLRLSLPANLDALWFNTVAVAVHYRISVCVFVYMLLDAHCCRMPHL